MSNAAGTILLEIKHAPIIFLSWNQAPKMDPELKAQIRQWKASMEAGNQFVLEEKRNQTPARRMEGLMAFLRGHAYLGIEREKPERRAHRMPYSEVQERLRDRHPERISRD